MSKQVIKLHSFVPHLVKMGCRMGVSFSANRETLPLVREIELRDACEIIGIHKLHLWKMQDKNITV